MAMAPAAATLCMSSYPQLFLSSKPLPPRLGRVLAVQETSIPNIATQEEMAPSLPLARPHPILRGGQPSPPHRFSPSQMQALSAVCDAFFPSIDQHEFKQHFPNDEWELLSDDLKAYYQMSATDLAVPLEVAGQMTKSLRRVHLRLVDLVLRLFASRWGTLLLGGVNALSPKFPFVLNLASLPVSQRQKILWSLSQSPFGKYQELFRFFKSFICWIIFTKVDENGQSPVLRAIKHKLEDPLKSSKIKGAAVRPLDGRVLDAGLLLQNLGPCLEELGFSSLKDVSELKTLMRQKGTLKGNRQPQIEVGVKCDCVIVGSGSGGSVIASILAKAGYKVLILEKGGYFAREDLSLLEAPSMYAMYEDGGCLVTEDLSTIVLAGSTVGGGSTINWAASLRTPPHVRREWAKEHKLEIFSSPEYDKAMDMVCDRLGVQSDVHNENLQNRVLRQGCLELGYHVENIPRNSQPDHYCGFCGFGCKTGLKQATPETWLVDASTHGAVILSGCKAEEVLHHERGRGTGKERKAKGIVASFGNGSGRIFIEAEVVVAACGALHTPPLLKRSGLRNPNIGKNLHLHPVQEIFGYLPESKGPEGVSFEGGIMTAFSNIAANWDSHGYGTLLQCVGAQPGLVAIPAPWRSGADYKRRLAGFSRIVVFIILARDKGSGSVDVDEEGRLKVNYRVSDFDKQSLKRGAEHGLRVMAAAGAEGIGTSNTDAEICRPQEVSEEQFEEYLGRVRSKAFNKLSTLTISAHQMGSCRMGIEPRSSVVDPKGETWEVEGLFLGDSSVFPTASGVNPMITVQSIAYCTGQSILEFLNSK